MTLDFCNITFTPKHLPKFSHWEVHCLEKVPKLYSDQFYSYFFLFPFTFLTCLKFIFWLLIDTYVLTFITPQIQNSYLNFHYYPIPMLPLDILPISVSISFTDDELASSESIPSSICSPATCILLWVSLPRFPYCCWVASRFLPILYWSLFFIIHVPHIPCNDW